jgi:hypothetical protein
MKQLGLEAPSGAINNTFRSSPVQEMKPSERLPVPRLPDRGRRRGRSSGGNRTSKH